MDPLHHEEGSLRHMVPSSFSHSEKQAIADLARAAHRALGLGHFSQADIILTRRGPYLLELNSTPGLYQGSAFPHMLESVGSSIKEFLQHAVRLAHL
jgi:D-alanine-D-alanine ligase-like ATP-grasp enzyme